MMVQLGDPHFWSKIVRRILTVAMIIPACVSVLALTGCGNSTPLPASGEPGVPTASNYTPSTGAFAAISALPSQGVTTVDTCNLDAVNDKPAGSEPVQHGSVVTFSGWAADAVANTVPASVQLVLKGAQDYAVDAATGAPRPDVAKANNRPKWAAAGYSVKADLSAVAPGTYTPLLAFDVDGKPVQCPTSHQLTVQ